MQRHQLSSPAKSEDHTYDFLEMLAENAIIDLDGLAGHSFL
jgi:hypothetical protein